VRTPQLNRRKVTGAMTDELVETDDLGQKWQRVGRKRRILSVIAIVVVFVAVAWLARTLAQSDQLHSAAARRGRPATTVGIATVKQADVAVNIEALGTVTPPATVTVSPQVAGVLKQILFSEGQLVHAGDVLAVIDPRPFELAQTQAAGVLLRDQAQLANARIQAERDRTLLKQDSIAEQDVETQLALVKQLEGTVKTDEAMLGAARLNVEWSRITAPVTGRMGLRLVDVGNYVNAGSSSGIVLITQVNPIDVEFAVSQDDVPRIQKRIAAGAQLPATALDRTRTTILAQGKFSTLDNQIDVNTGTIKAKARFANDSGALYPSQFVNVVLLLDTVQGAVVAPVVAVRSGANGDFVYVLNANRTVSVRAVKRGQADGAQVAIASGLKVGEQVITEGGDRLSDGATVQVAADVHTHRAAGAAAQPATPEVAPTPASAATPASGKPREQRPGKAVSTTTD
jgi:multidrug efflux system membrane fusion protein